MTPEQRGEPAGVDVPEVYQNLVLPHIASYDYFLTAGLERCVEELEPIQIEHPVTKAVHTFWISDPMVGMPLRPDAQASDDKTLLPSFCREAGMTYKANFSVNLHFSTADGERHNVRSMGGLPIMLRSKNCYLRGCSRRQLVRKREEATEMGGTFICNGIERIIRLLILPRRHYIMAECKSAYKNRGPGYSDMATTIRCVARDETSTTSRCYYRTDGTVSFSFVIRRSEFLVPAGILLKALVETSDREIYDRILASQPQDSAGGPSSFVAERVELLLRQAAREGVHTQAQAVQLLGARFRIALYVPSEWTDHRAGEYLLEKAVFIHLGRKQGAEKLALLLAMLAKLYSFVSGACAEDNPDALTHQELLLPGHLLMKFTKEKLEESLRNFKKEVERDLEQRPEAVDLTSEKYINDKAAKTFIKIGERVEYLLNTGNLGNSPSGLGLTQKAGFTVVAEKINFFRFLSHFRSVHRGAFFAQMRTTTVRKLLPESWGFMCPVHTPDGSPCGLLNHLTAVCQVVTDAPEDPEALHQSITMVLVSLGMAPWSAAMPAPQHPTYQQVMVDGRVVGFLAASRIPAVLSRLRLVKAAVYAEESVIANMEDGVYLTKHERQVPSHLETVYIPYEPGGPFPGLFLFTQAARMTRAVKQIASGELELIGSLEQAHMSISCPDGGHCGSKGSVHTHAELHTSGVLSVIASLTPYSDFNQSPRNMYQCQMGKQTMGTPAQALKHRTDNKLYRLHTPQTPIARTQRYTKYHMDEFPMGMNMVVAVIAYTGYDMEDAMILNKSSVERGLAHATLYKTETIDLHEESKRTSAFGVKPRSEEEAAADRERVRPKPQGAFGAKSPQNVVSRPGSSAAPRLKIQPDGSHMDSARIDVDGLPHVGAAVWPKQPYASVMDQNTGYCKLDKLKGEEQAVVEQVTVIGSGNEAGCRRANIKLRINRNPVIGDKFSSRHGQKGVMSQQWPDENMPYVATTGMRPDLLINPHAFPSRMTIGMLIESLTSKAGVLCGEFVDATPFQNSDGTPTDPIKEFGDRLEAKGFARHGGETMVSGVTGEEFAVDIFIGPVYYQRLRHMVSDKFQVRSTGPINPLTRQPVKGRKVGGGIRFGEMERDALLAHGAAYLLHDRLHTCSDYTVTDVCTTCGSMLSPTNAPRVGAAGMHYALEGSGLGNSRGRVVCRLCNSSKNIERVALPYVFRYLLVELACMNIRCNVEIQN